MNSASPARTTLCPRPLIAVCKTEPRGYGATASADLPCAELVRKPPSLLGRPRIPRPCSYRGPAPRAVRRLYAFNARDFPGVARAQVATAPAPAEMRSAQLWTYPMSRGRPGPAVIEAHPVLRPKACSLRSKLATAGRAPVAPDRLNRISSISTTRSDADHGGAEANQRYLVGAVFARPPDDETPPPRGPNPTGIETPRRRHAPAHRPQGHAS